MKTKINISTGAENIIKGIIVQQIVLRKIPIHRIRNCGIKRAKEIFKWAGIAWPKKITDNNYHDHARTPGSNLIQ